MLSVNPISTGSALHSWYDGLVYSIEETLGGPAAFPEAQPPFLRPSLLS